MTAMRTQHSLAGQVYAVPLIQPDLRREEAIQQVADALQYLQNISGDIFSSGRATLLESIRQAGGIGKAKRRSVKERKLEKKKQKEQEQVRASSQGGDLMSDLFNKLVMRRKGISGKGPGTGSSEGPGGAFSRMSDSIPPLPPPQQPAGDEDEDDWES